MIKQQVQTLRNEKAKAIKMVRASNVDARTKKIALNEININFLTTQQFLERIAHEGWEINDDLSSIREDYDANESYRGLYNHVSHHFWELSHIPKMVVSGKFKPSYVHYF